MEEREEKADFNCSESGEHPSLGFANPSINPDPTVLAQWIAGDDPSPENLRRIEDELRALPDPNLLILHSTFIRSNSSSVCEDFAEKAFRSVKELVTAPPVSIDDIALA